MTVSDEHPGPLNFNVGQLRNAIVVPGRLVVYGFTVTNTNASAQYVCVFDGSTLPGNGAVPLFSWPLAANNGVGFGWQPNGRQFQGGLVICNSSKVMGSFRNGRMLNVFGGIAALIMSGSALLLIASWVGLIK